WVVAGVALRYLVNRPEDRGLQGYGADASPTGPRAATAPAELIAAAVLRHPVFWGGALGHLVCCAAHSGPIFHMVAHAMDLGVTKMAAASMLGLSGGTSIAGRLSSGILADRFGARPALVGMLAIQALVLSFYLYAGAAASLFVVALFFGVAYGGAMPLYALVAREFFGERVVGTTFGGIFFISCIGMGHGAEGGAFLSATLGPSGSLHRAVPLAAAVPGAVPWRSVPPSG